MLHYTVWAYDVIGNTTDGFEVNDRRCLHRSMPVETTEETYNKGKPGEFTEDLPSDQQVCTSLIAEGFMSAVCNPDNLVFDGDDENITIDDATGYPLWGLDLNKD